MEDQKEELNKGVLLFVLISGCFLSVLNQTLLNVALSNLMEVFKVTAATVQWLSTGFLLVNGMLVPITAFLMKRFTTRQLFISSMSFLLLGTIICATAPTFMILLIGRMIQAIGAGIILPLMMNVIMLIFPAEKRGGAMGLIGFAMIFAPAIAPTLAGFTIDYVSWRWLFIGLTPLIVLVIGLSFKFLVNVSETEKSKLDIVSVVFSTIGFGFILYGFSNAGNNGWASAVVVFSLIIGLLFTIFFCVRQIKSKEPVLNLSVFKYKTFTLTSLLNVLITMIMYADLILLPIYLQTGRGFTALEAGLLLLPGAIINAVLSPFTGRLYDRVGAKPLFIVGLLFIIPSMWAVTDLTVTTSFVYLMIRTIILRIGLSFITMPINTSALNALPKQLAAHGSAAVNTVRLLAGAIGTAVVVTIYTSQVMSYTSTIINENPSASSGQIEKLSSVSGSGDAYFFMMILAIVALLVTLFMPRTELKKEENNGNEPG
ncbi:DHA2 family efflux MFS transporter permease subunit [Marinococcus sp. PL1-022]|uniref:DHA2 family efflux MFS transporter permease subunit n=1 Tax=Marinococcus sp. PL1-022 TaxID=3095363 RepID=UPI0029C44A5F|nr:DHA2 family efflux MFS transporter permease subunit [Marinococcus sp. PL1-022]MDX6153093.1 DHA2 family efflux MFS transporter permease subunit [Marinococcus sp. PL1-022]